MNSVLNEIIYYIGLIGLVGGLISYIVMLAKKIKTSEESNSLKEFILKNKIEFGVPALSFLVGFILLNIAFFTNSYNRNYLSNNSIDIKWYSYILVYFIGSLFIISLISLIFIFYIHLYVDKFKLVKKTKIITFTSLIVLTVIFFFSYTEGLAPYLEYPLANCLHIGLRGIKVFNYYNDSSSYSNGINIFLYAIFILSGACLVLYVADYKLYKEYGHHDLITNTFLVGFPMGIVGARIWYVVLDISAEGSSSIYVQNFWNIFDVRNGGLGIMGGAILGIICGVSQLLIVKYAKKKEAYKEFSLLKAIDIIVPCILFAQAIGRIGNFFNNEVYGYLTYISPWEWLPSIIKNNMYYDHGDILSTTMNGVKYSGEAALNFYKSNGYFYIPLFAVEFLTNLSGYFIIEYGIRKALGKYHSDGSLLGCYLIWYGLTRVFLEPMRTGADYYLTSYITSFVMIGLGVLVIVLAFINKEYLKKKGLLWYKKKEEND